MNKFLSNIPSESTYSISFEATKGEQFGKHVFTAQAKLIDIIVVFEVDPSVQRELDSTQVANITSYIVQRLKDARSPIFFPPFVFSSRGHGEYIEDKLIYKLKLDNKIAVLDGQHRLEAFKGLEARLRESEYADEQELYQKLKEIPLTLQIYEDLTIEQEQQLFTDINSMNTKVNANIIKYYNESNITSRMMRDIVHNHPSIAFEQFEVRKNTTRRKLMSGLIVYKLIAMLHSKKYITNQIDYEFPKSDYNVLKEKTSLFLTLLVKYMPSLGAYDRNKSIYLDQSIILAIGKVVYDIKDMSKWEDFFREVIFNYNWSHSNKDLLAARVAYNHETRRFRLTPETKVINIIYQALKKRLK